MSYSIKQAWLTSPKLIECRNQGDDDAALYLPRNFRLRGAIPDENSQLETQKFLLSNSNLTHHECGGVGACCKSRKRHKETKEKLR